MTDSLPSGISKIYKGRNCYISHSQIAIVEGCQKTDPRVNSGQMKNNNLTHLMGPSSWEEK